MYLEAHEEYASDQRHISSWLAASYCRVDQVPQSFDILLNGELRVRIIRIVSDKWT